MGHDGEIDGRGCSSKAIVAASDKSAMRLILWLHTCGNVLVRRAPEARQLSISNRSWLATSTSTSTSTSPFLLCSHALFNRQAWRTARRDFALRLCCCYWFLSIGICNHIRDRRPVHSQHPRAAAKALQRSIPRCFITSSIPRYSKFLTLTSLCGSLRLGQHVDGPTNEFRSTIAACTPE